MQKWRIDLLFGHYAIVEERDGYLFAFKVKGFVISYDKNVYRHVGLNRVRVESLSELKKGTQVVFTDNPDLAVPIFTIDSIYKLDEIKEEVVSS